MPLSNSWLIFVSGSEQIPKYSDEILAENNSSPHFWVVCDNERLGNSLSGVIKRDKMQCKYDCGVI